ncbi:hypothetical protein FNF28_04929 [Cafeteria roenbergensis]|uniref:Uncharacterized protein n=1 Tax=Cafeteria roenbergensis TaxID=33653 RepID=A0A5A8DBA9_CAFRO|nr:hypothetical protein FNF28_04929 [Cafeteria roenbergensis]
MPAAGSTDTMDSGDHMWTFASQYAIAGLAISAGAVIYTWPFHKAGTKRLAMFSRYAFQLVPIMTGAGAVHSSIFTLVSINGALGGCMLLGATGAAGALYKHARRVPGTETGARAEDLSSTVAAGGRV